MFTPDPIRQTASQPIVVQTRQVGANQILFTYNQRADLASATNVSNYWIRSNAGPNGVASLSMGDALMRANAIRPDLGMIRPVDDTKMNFIMTFRNNIPSGTLYVLLPCFVNQEGGSGFTGGNWGPSSMNMFIGM
jgi:hypothetical protein